MLLKTLLQRFGYQMRKVPRAISHEAAMLHLDAYDDQSFLMQGKEPLVIFDIGAHNGQTAVEYKQRFGSATIHSFEPFPASYAQAQKNTRDFPNVFVHNVAIGQSKSREKLYYTDFSPMNSLLQMAESSKEFLDEANPEHQQFCEVEVITLDEFCTAQGVETIDLCKMDVQGAELRALKGAERLLTEKRIRLIYLEVNFNPYYEQQASFAQVYDFLSLHGFTLFGLYDLNYGKTNLRLTEANAIFVSSSLTAALVK